MTLALVTATAAEMKAALAGVDASGETPRRGRAAARVDGRDMLLAVTGVGPVNAALEMGALLASHAVSGVVNLGIAGSFDLERAPLCSAVAADMEIYPEYGVAGDDGLADASGFAFPQWEAEGLTVRERLPLFPMEAAAAMGLAIPAGMLLGAAITVTGITGSRRRADSLAARHGALTESMEGFALALACRTRGVPFLEVRAVSNLVGERDRGQWKLASALEGLGYILAGLISGARQTGSDPSAPS